MKSKELMIKASTGIDVIKLRSEIDTYYTNNFITTRNRIVKACSNLEKLTVLNYLIRMKETSSSQLECYIAKCIIDQITYIPELQYNSSMIDINKIRFPDTLNHNISSFIINAVIDADTLDVLRVLVKNKIINWGVIMSKEKENVKENRWQEIGLIE